MPFSFFPHHKIQLPQDDAAEIELLSSTERGVSHPQPTSPYRRWIVSALVLVAILAALEVVRMAMESSLILSSTIRGTLEAWYPVAHLERTDIYLDENNKAMHALATYSVVLLGSGHFAGALEGLVSGENIWALSLITALRELNYTILFSKASKDSDDLGDNELAGQYRQFPSLVKVAIVQGEASTHCLHSVFCIKSTVQPLGVPAWKTLTFNFWPSAENPLGHHWTISPENYINVSGTPADTNTYVGYSVERTCTARRVVPPAQRAHRAYVYGKYDAYFAQERYPWAGMSFAEADGDDIDAAGPLAGVAGVVNGTTRAPVPPGGLPGGIANLGALGRDAFYDAVGRSKVLVGVGGPIWSPTPYEALCMGVPFVNPVSFWDADHPDDRARWETQHDGLKWTDEPWVYHVRKGDVEGLRAALKRATENPIDRYIVPEMTMDALKERLTNVIEADWRSRAEELLAERKASGKGELFVL